jgi:hypothetical protein
MSKKVVLFIMLVLGLVLIGGGVFLKYGKIYHSKPENTPVAVNIPKSDPVIYERALYTMGGENYELYIYRDGSLLYIQEKGLRFPSPEHPGTRTWSTGNLTAERMNDLLAYLENSGLDKLEDSYYFPGKTSESGGFSQSDLQFTFIVNGDNLRKKVTAFGYLSPDRGETYPDMPPPINDIYIKLRGIALATQQVYQENIK